MKMYLMFGVKSFTNQLSYRSEVWLRLLGTFVTILIQTEIWKAVIGNGSVNGVTIQQMITYSVLNTVTLSLLLNKVSGKVDNSLKTGSIASELIKPISYPFYLLADGLGSSLYQFVFTVIPSLLISWLAFGLIIPPSLFHFFGFLIAIFIALFVSFLLGYLISLIAFWLMNHFALSWMMGGLITIFSGSFLPMWFFPDSWRSIANILPFQYLGYVPAAVYIGNISDQEVIKLLLQGVLWIVILICMNKWLWNRAVKRLVVQGG